MSNEQQIDQEWALNLARGLGEIEAQVKLLPEVHNEVVSLRTDVQALRQVNEVFKATCLHHRQSMKRDVLDLLGKTSTLQDKHNALTQRVTTNAKAAAETRTIWKTLTILAGVIVTVISLTFATLQYYANTGEAHGKKNTTWKVDPSW
jgi:hypothetical protein